MHEPLIHILLPTYEPRPDFLRKAVESVITQTEQRWTLHINDDASTTDVRAIVAPYLADPRITFARNSQRLGIGGNWNACLQTALSPRLPAVASAKEGERVRVRGTAPYIQFLFQDDLWDFGYLARVLHAMEEHPMVGLISLEHDYDCEEGIASAPLYDDLRRFRREHIAPGVHSGKELLLWWLERGLHPNIIGEPSFVMLRRSAVEDIGLFDRRMRQNLDVEYWTRMLERNDWYYCAENGGTFRVHSAGASERNRCEGRGLFDRLRTIERVLRRSGKRRQERASVLAHHLGNMMQKFHRQPKERKHHFLFSLPLLSFCLRHPHLTIAAIFHTTRAEPDCASLPAGRQAPDRCGSASSGKRAQSGEAPKQSTM